MKTVKIFSPNHDKRKRSINSIKIIVIHYTGMQSERESIEKLCNPTSKVSSHYLINRKGKIFRIVEDKKVAWHAGISCWKKYKNLNKISLGIELVNRGHQFGYNNFEQKQISSLIKLCKQLKKKYNIENKNIVGHSDIAPTRKIDPGEKFPWKYLAKKQIGIWHDYEHIYLKKFRRVKILVKKDKIKCLQNLTKIGYYFSLQNKQFLTKIIKAFQRHYRKELIDGFLDQECHIILKNLIKKL